jgi:FkbM family methyltransferase
MQEQHLRLPEIKLPLLLKLLRRLDFLHKKWFLNKLFGSYLNKQGIGWASTWNGIKWLIDGRSHCHRWMIYDRYAESAYLKWAEKNLSPSSVIVDSGSNIGQFLPYYAKIVAKGQIYSFEPSDKLYSWIEDCIEYNDLKNIKVFKKGLGDKKMLAQLEAPSEEILHGLWGKVVETGGDESISITTLTDALENENVSQIDLWKLDVEGFEYAALQGALPLIKKKMLKAAYIEMIPDTDNSKNVHALMTEHGFEPWICHHFSKTPLREFPQNKFDILYILKG